MSAATTHGNFTDAAFVITDDSTLSATAAFTNGEYALEMPTDGRAIGVYESQGAVTGLRKEARAFVTLTITGHLTTPLDAFRKLASGKTSGFVSTTADIGDVPCVDGQLTTTYSTSTRRYVLEDLHMESMSHSGGSPNSYTCNFTGYAKVSMTDETGATVILVAGR